MDAILAARRMHLAILAPLILAAACAGVLDVPAESAMPAPPLMTYAAPVTPEGVPDPPSEAPAEPLPGLTEVAPPKPPKQTPVGHFTRKIDRARVEARGARDKAGFDAAILQAAATFDNETWRGEPRRELLAYLRGGARDRDKDKSAGTEFGPADARIVAQLQAGCGAVVDGQLRDETMAILFAMGFRFTGHKVTPWEVKVEFYPGELEDLDAWNREIAETVAKGGGYRTMNTPVGEGTIYVRVGRSIVASYRGRGGPPSPIIDDADHIAVASKPGDYKLGPPHAHVSRNWYFSQIPWGAELRKKDDGYQWRWPGRSGGWSWATANPTAKLKVPLDESDFEDLPEETRDGETFLIWNKNDFGPLAWNLVPSDMYVHTTPDAEHGVHPPGAGRVLTCSHGCIHIAPKERDEMIKLGYLGTGVPFVVRPWDQHVLPDPVRHDLITGTGVASK